MKSLPRKLLPLTLFVISVTSLFSVRPVKAYTVTLKEVGSDVVANGSGAINLTGLFSPGSTFGVPAIQPESGVIIMGPIDPTDGTEYLGITGPPNFGSGGPFSANASSGDFVGVGGLGGVIFVPVDYVSNTSLSDSMTFNSQTFASLGVTPGTYTWTWGTGLPNQNFTLIIGGAGVPDGGSTVSLLGCALLGLTALRRKLGY